MTTSTRCQDCISNQFCIPSTLNHYETNQLDSIILRKKPLHRGQLLFESGDKLTALYAIRSGIIKSYTVTQQGKEQITAFYSTGDILGFDAINTLRYPTSARVLDTSMVCEIPFENLEHLSSKIPSLRRQLLRLMSRHIQYDQENLSITRKKAKTGLATFIYKLICNRAQRGLSPTSLRLSMSHTEIGNYLGLSLETISRLFSNLQESGILMIKGRYITIQDSDKLARISNNG
ncbi:fumarate/nitrate reduction transcriptional regulator Fnr [unidentified bacterial endosymbiont]|uniref:fumarate/nitrate reduction transcriptional regulator Fnr n=1 Tax=unidentified bacterial endosymbiont TaxID=2355 RepID=UPI0020A1C08A|nr:fumarate/nitrate reduction transcriptional regulator Fnr [unidentified bacterial endosymbiont]